MTTENYGTTVACANESRRRVSIVLFIAVGLNAPVYGVQNSPINAGCYIAAPDQCLIHVDRFTINVTPGKRLTSFKLLAGPTSIYEFATDMSNPPVGNYSPSAPKKDFAATCGQTYTVALSAKDTGDAGYVQVGSVTGLTCPVGTGWLSWIPKGSTETGGSKAKGSVTFNGTANAQGGLTHVSFQYGTTTAYGFEVSATPNDFTDTGNHRVSAGATGLAINGFYHYRIVVTNSQGTVYGQDQIVRASGVDLTPIYMLLLD